MSKHKDYYPEFTKKIKEIKDWIIENDAYIERIQKHCEEYEAKRRQNNEANNK